MTEDEWLEAADPEPMLQYLQTGLLEHLGRNRKFRLFACVCCRRIWHLLTDPRSQVAIEVAERYADALVPSPVLEEAARAADLAAQEGERSIGLQTESGYASWWKTWDASWASVDARRAAAWAAWTGPGATEAAVVSCWHAARAMWAAGDMGWDEERAEQADLVREVFGNPFRPVAVPETWPADLVKMASEVYGHEHGFFGIRYLLEGLGYTELAEHFLSQDDWHPKGCWALDLILGKG
jgi:hypothetical protein